MFNFFSKPKEERNPFSPHDKDTWFLYRNSPPCSGIIKHNDLVRFDLLRTHIAGPNDKVYRNPKY